MINNQKFIKKKIKFKILIKRLKKLEIIIKLICKLKKKQLMI